MTINPDYIRKIVSGEDKTALGCLLRGLLSCVEGIYAPLVRLRNRRFDNNPRTQTFVPAPVISIGNLTFGGTGKTPLSCAIIQRLQDRGLRPAIISRGYKAKSGEYNDEALEVLRRLPGLIYVQNPQRSAAAMALLSRSCSERPDVLVLDDGFQHRKLARDFDIVLLDAQNPFGFGRLCPRGFLREPISGLRRADAIILTRSDSVDSGRVEQIRQEAQRWNPTAVWAQATHQAASWQRLDGLVEPLNKLNGKRAVLFCALGNPLAFLQTAEETGLEKAAFVSFADHHRFTVDEAYEIVNLAVLSKADAIVCSMKDFVKWPLSVEETRAACGKDAAIPLFGLQIDFQFTQYADSFWNALDQAIDTAQERIAAQEKGLA